MRTQGEHTASLPDLDGKYGFSEPFSLPKVPTTVVGDGTGEIEVCLVSESALQWSSIYVMASICDQVPMLLI